MRSLPTEITTQKNKPAGAQPVWILKLPRYGTTPIYLSDRKVTFWDASAAMQTAKPWVSSWGSIKEGITNGLGELSVGDFDVHILSDPLEFYNIVYQVQYYDLETEPAELFLWFDGMNEPENIPPVLIFSGYVKEISIDRNDAGVELRLQDATLKLQGTVGTVLDTATYPLADPDHIGKLLPIVYGSVAKLPALCVDAGWVTSLANQIIPTDTTVTVSELPSTSVVGKTFYIDAEQITVTSVNTTTRVLTVTRGANSSTIANHATGTVIIEKKATPIVFLLADHVLDTIGDIFIRVAGVDVNITTSVTKYLGTPANQLTAYPGKAAITIATTPTVLQQIHMSIENSLSLNDALHNHAAGTLTTTNVVSDTQNLAQTTGTASTNLRYLPAGTYTLYGTALTKTFPAPPGTILTCTLSYTITCPSGSYIYMGDKLIEGPTPSYNNASRSYTFNSSDAAGMAQNTFSVRVWLWSGTIYTPNYTYDDIRSASATASVSRSFTYNSITSSNVSVSQSNSGVALTGDLSLVGNNIANVYTMDQLMASVARTSVATPLLAINDILTRAGQLVATGSSAITTAINGAITDQRSAITWLGRLAFEAWALFKVSGAGSKLIPRGTGASQKTITISMIRNYTRRKSAYEDIINKIDLRFDLDYSNTTADPYRQTVSAENATSQGRYGNQDRTDLFSCQFITSSAIATSLRDAYLTFYSDRHWVYDIEVFLDNIEVEFGDSITLGFITGSPVGVVREARVTPGDDTDPDTIILVVEV
jgi:hypothetical protein